MPLTSGYRCAPRGLSRAPHALSRVLWSRPRRADAASSSEPGSAGDHGGPRVDASGEQVAVDRLAADAELGSQQRLASPGGRTLPQPTGLLGGQSWFATGVALALAAAMPSRWRSQDQGAFKTQRTRPRRCNSRVAIGESSPVKVRLSLTKSSRTFLEGSSVLVIRPVCGRAAGAVTCFGMQGRCSARDPCRCG